MRKRTIGSLVLCGAAAALAAILDRHDIPLMFGGITAEQIVKTIFE